MHDPMRGRRPLSYLSIVAAMAAWTGESLGMEARTVSPPDWGICGLPGCGKPANRGGYCCTEHCREARELDRKARGISR